MALGYKGLGSERETYANRTSRAGQNRRIMGRGDATDWPGSCAVAPTGGVENSDGYPRGIKVEPLTYPARFSPEGVHRTVVEDGMID